MPMPVLGRSEPFADDTVRHRRVSTLSLDEQPLKRVQNIDIAERQNRSEAPSEGKHIKVARSEVPTMSRSKKSECTHDLHNGSRYNLRRFMDAIAFTSLGRSTSRADNR